MSIPAATVRSISGGGPAWPARQRRGDDDAVPDDDLKSRPAGRQAGGGDGPAGRGDDQEGRAARGGGGRPRGGARPPPRGGEPPGPPPRPPSPGGPPPHAPERGHVAGWGGRSGEDAVGACLAG